MYKKQLVMFLGIIEYYKTNMKMYNILFKYLFIIDIGIQK